MKVALFLCVQIFVSAIAVPIAEEETKTTSNHLETERTYEITEDVDDIPDTRPKLPIVTNFEVEKPLNLANINNTKEKSTKFSLLQIHSEIDHENFFTEFDENTENSLLNGIKTYYKQFKNILLNGIQDWIKSKIDSLKL